MMSLQSTLMLTFQPQSLTNTHRNTPHRIHLFKKVISILQTIGILILILQFYCHTEWILFILTKEMCIL